jgi:catechol 2,3-dioxygenase-like lactoylglutathione lyase family enzyme
MKMIPLFRCTDMMESIRFYTQILDFELFGAVTEEDWVAPLRNGDAALLLTRLEGDQKLGISVNVLVTDVDALFVKYSSRGLDQSHRTESPVHLRPTNQSWGSREFYVTDPDGNTLRFVQPQ